MAAPWVRETDGSYRCTRHGETWQAPASCPKCADDPAPVAVKLEEQSSDVPPDCQTVRELEQESALMKREVKLVLDALRAIKKKSIGHYQSIGKLYDVWLKFVRLQGEYAAARERRAYVAKLRERDAEMRKERKRR